MEFMFALCLPREAGSVPVVRHMIGATLRHLGVEDGCVSDVELAVTEACSNVLKHAEGADEYEVAIEVTDHRATLRIKDEGVGFEQSPRERSALELLEEKGRGIPLMEGLADEVDFTTDSEGRNVVVLTKALQLQMDSALIRLASAGYSG